MKGTKKSPNARPDGPTLPAQLNLTAIAVMDLDAGAEGTTALPRFRMVAYTGAPMRVVGWRHPVVIDLAGLSIESQARPIRFGHDPLSGVGHTDAIRVEQGQLIASGVVSRDTPAAREVVVSSKNGFPWQASVGASVEEFEFIRENQVVHVNGRDYSGPLNVVRKASLGEISFVDLGADGGTSAQVAAQSQPQVGDNHVNETSNTIDAEPTEAPALAVNAASLVGDIRAQAASETKRITAIRKLCAGRCDDIEAEAIEHGWSTERTELAVLRASRPQGPAIHAASDNATPRILEAALCMRTGLRVDDQYDGQTLELAERYSKRGFRWCAERICAMHGRSIDADPGTTEWIRAAFSTSELSGIVGNVANKALQAAFQAAASIADRISATRSHTNFHAHTVYSLVLSGELQPVAPDGELKHLSLGEESRTRQVSTRGALLSVTRTDLVNDELGALTENAAALGRKAVHSREKALFTLLNATAAGASFFTTARKNYFEGASTNLSSDSLTTAVRLFRDQTGPDGDPILVEPRLLLIPTNLEQTAKELMNSQFILGPTSAKTPAVNVWQGSFTPLTSPWLSNANLTGASTTAWYLFADPSDVPVLEVAYLNGQQTPTVEFFGLDTDPKVLGVTWRVFWDFGVALAEYRAGVKSKGAA
jgi:hypothetical protein